MITNYTAAARAAIAEHKAINCKIFSAHCEGPDFTAAAARELFHLYRDSAAALIMAVADYRAAVTNSQTPDPAPVLTAARGYLGKFAPDRHAAFAMLFDVASGETDSAAASRIVTALAPVAINGTAKDTKGTRRGTINLNADSAATSTVMTALEQWAIDRLDGVQASNAAALVEDKKARKAAQKAAREQRKAEQAAKKAEQAAKAAAVAAVQAKAKAPRNSTRKATPKAPAATLPAARA